MSQNDFKEALIEYAKDEATEIALCLIKFKQNAPDCVGCPYREFCTKLKDKLDEGEAQGTAEEVKG